MENQEIPCSASLTRKSFILNSAIGPGDADKKLEGKQLIAVESTSYIDNHGMKWNGNNLYTILPIQQVVDTFYQQQLDRLESTAERQRVAKLLREQESPA